MHKKLSDFINSLVALQAIIDKASIVETGFQAHGWKQVHLKKEQVSYFIDNYITKLKAYGDANLTEELEDSIEKHTQSIKLLTNTSQSYFTNNAQHLIYSVPIILLTLNTIFSDIDYELFSYENIQDKKLLPKNLTKQLRSANTQVDSINESISTLQEKITVINDAHEAAESLPTDLASLQDAKNKLDKLIKDASSEFSKTQKELQIFKEEILSLKNNSQKSSEESILYKEKIQILADEASNLVNQCDDALQITTTQGLAAGFDQKAKELSNSIWIWIIGLLIALFAGGYMGSERVDVFTEALQNNLTAGQAILHTIMSIFSIGGPLWLAWISTQQINQRFKLSEDYSYKATVAKSFTGFKKHAERFDSTTEERLFNSILDRLDEMPLRLIKEKDYNSPWHEFTDSESFKKAIDLVPGLAREVGNFANRTDLQNKKINIKSKSKVEDEVSSES